MFTEKLFQTICWVLLHSLWQGLLLALLTGLLLVLSKKSSAAIRYNLLSGILVLFLIIVSLTFYREWNLISDQGQTNSALVHQLLTYHIPEKIVTQQTAPATGPLAQFMTQFKNYFSEHASLIVTIWFIVFMAKSVRILSGLVQIQRIRHYRTHSAPADWIEKLAELGLRMNISQKISLLESAIIKIPVVIGWLKPTILVPIGLLNNLSAQEVESILLHELAHIRRRDYFFNLVQSFVDILFFFNPAILWISSLVRNERENCCDDIAVEHSKNKKQFIQALVSFHQYNATTAKYTMAFAGRKSQLIDRVKRIATNNQHSLNQKEKVILVLGFLVMSIALITYSQGERISKEESLFALTANNTATEKKDSVPHKSYTAAARIHKQSSPDRKKSISVRKEALPSSDQKKNSIIVSDIHIKVNANIVTAMTDPSDDDADESLSDFSALGYKDISPSEVAKLRDHGVTASLIKRFAELGFTHLSLSQAMNLKDHGVSPKFVRSFELLGYEKLSLDQALDLKDHGVSAEFINTFMVIGYERPSLDFARELKDHGVRPDDLYAFRALGFKNISLQTMKSMVDHGVSPAYVAGLQSLGFRNVSLEKAQQLKDHGVSNEFIATMKKKTGSELSLDDYISLKDQL